jgi:hypothetical protein
VLTAFSLNSKNLGRSTGALDTGGLGQQLGGGNFPRALVLFQGEDFAGSPLHTDDLDETVAALLSFLSLRPGDTDREYFDNYRCA